MSSRYVDTPSLQTSRPISVSTFSLRTVHFHVPRRDKCGHGADIVVEAAGYQDTLNMTFRIVRQFGMIMAFGVQGESPVMIDHPMMMSRQPTIVPTTGGRIPNPMEPIRTMVALKERGWIATKPICCIKRPTRLRPQRWSRAASSLAIRLAP